MAMIYIREDIPSKLLDKHAFPYDIWRSICWTQF